MSKRRPDDRPIVHRVEVLDDPDDTVQGDRDEQTDLDRGRRQLRRGRLARLNDRLAGGPARPGEQQLTRSPFVLGMGFAIPGLVIIAGAFWFLIVHSNETRRLDAATQALTEARYAEAEKKFASFLIDYPSGDSADAARVGMHTAAVRKYTEDTRSSVNSVVQAQSALDAFIRNCRDLPAFNKDDVIQFAQWITDAGAQVAAKQASQKALDASVAALSHLKNFSDDESLSPRTVNELVDKQRQAEAAILKEQVLASSLDKIRSTNESGNIMEALHDWQQLGTRYEALRADADFLALRDEILQNEQQRIMAASVGTAALTTDDDTPALHSLSLNLRTQASADRLSQDQRVFGWSGSACYALDSETGEPIWKKHIGAAAPFPPTVVDAREPALLAWSDPRQELILLRQNDGTILWRQPFDSLPTGPPLILDQQIYLTTEAGDLWQVSVNDGEAVARIHFSQPVVGPPAVSRDEGSLILPGRDSVIYTVSRRPFECTATSWLGHKAGTVASPMIGMGHLFLVCENESSDRARLHAMDFSPETGRLTPRAAAEVSGQIWDPCLLRGDQLFVPSTPQRVTAFRVSDAPDTDTLSRIGTNQLEDAVFASMYLLPGPGGNLWMASTSLRRFQVTTNAVLLDDAVVAEGQHLYPIRFQGDSLYVGTTEPSSASVFFTRVNRSTMQGIWRTVLSTNIVAAGPSDSNEALLAVSDFGEIFRVPLREIDAAGFHTESISRLRLPDGPRGDVGGLTLPDGRLAAWCTGKEPAIWTVNTTGHLEQRWSLPDAPEADPVPLADGIVAGLPGRLHMTAVTGGRVDDYRAADTSGGPATWKFLVPVSATQVLAFNSDDQIVRVEYRATPRPHLTEISTTRLHDTIDVVPVVSGESLISATIDGRLLLMKTDTLEVAAERSLGGAPGEPPLIAGDLVFVSIDGQTLVHRISDGLTPTASFANDRAEFVAPILTRPDGRFVAALTNGTVLTLDQKGAPEGEPLRPGQSLQRGPMAIGDAVIVIGQDGSLFSLTDYVSR